MFTHKIHLLVYLVALSYLCVVDFRFLGGELPV